MKKALPNVLLIFGCLGASHASTGDTPTSIVRAQRAEYNSAIAAHDAVRLRTFFVDDYHLILRSSGDADSGGEGRNASQRRRRSKGWRRSRSAHVAAAVRHEWSESSVKHGYTITVYPQSPIVCALAVPMI